MTVDSAETVDEPASGPISPLGIATVVALVFGIILLAQVFLLPAADFGTDNPNFWQPTQSRAELLVAKMDGQAFAQLADDPLMENTVAVYHGDEGAAAYRAARPLNGWLYFIASAGGQRPLIAPAILVLTALTAGLVVLATSTLGRTLGSPIQLLGLVLAMPAVVASMAYPGICEPLACVLALTGLAAWVQERTWLAVGLLSAAVLTRETMLLVPLGLALDVLIRTRRLRPALPLVVPAAVYASWVAIVKVRLGALPSGSSMDRPLAGFSEGVVNWKAAEGLTAGLLVASGIAIVRYGPSWMKAILACHTAFFVFMNYQVWWVWWGFGRVGTILPLLGLVALSQRTHKQDTDETGVALAPV